MKKILPEIQIAWREYEELYKENQEALHWYQYLTSLNSIVLFIIPFILSIYYNASFCRPRKWQGHRKNRNI